jgi:2-polyprenyl-6-methoxyphenol hydroxylase-like FAD-dependent oxidoreductase
MGNFRFNIGIVVGGVAAAVALHRAGIQATVYERANELREVGAGMRTYFA